MNRQAKSAIKSFVLELRHMLEDEIEIQLKRYGFAGERWLPLDRLPHIQGDDRATIEHYRLRAALEQHLRRIGADPERAEPTQRAEAADWFVREVAFTHLNRLVALKCLEVRGLIPEVITTREAYGGRSRAHYDYRNAHPDEARQPDDALPAAIRHACREVYAEFKFLFDVGDPAAGREPQSPSILWPSYPVLKECIALINGLDERSGNNHGGVEGSVASTLWAEDEIIGWIYQFYNAEHKEAVRSRGRPRRPAEVAVINQFFTPRWICKYLVDNTLGRLWLEMHPDSERVRTKCDYLVPEPLPSPSEGKGTGESVGFPLDPDSPINDPRAPARREPRPVTEIRLIDPACGTMHFGHYAFEVFYEMYLDSLERGWPLFPSHSGRAGPGMEVSEGDIPALILRHNLYGVDIDLRAVQLAGLSLFIKAKAANPKAHISHVNLVVADAVLPADGARQQFLDQYKDDKVVQDAVRQVLEEMANVAEVGSLLRVEERLRGILAEAGHTAARDLDRDRQEALPGIDGPPRQLSLAEVPEAMPQDWGAHYTLNRLLEDVRQFANRALQAHDLNAQLFAEEAAKTVHLLDVFLNEYDVVVMNPPFGDTLSGVQKSLKRMYPSSYKNLLCTFLDRGRLLTRTRSGLVGAIVDNSVTLRSTYERFREKVLIEDSALLTMADLGWEVLDANVETVALILRGTDSDSRKAIATFFRVNDIEPEHKDDALRSLIENSRRGKRSEDVFLVDLAELMGFPNKALSYWVPGPMRRLFRDHPSLDPEVATITEGIKPADAVRFIKYWWEVPPDHIGGRDKKWMLLSNGGYYSPFYRTITQAILYENDGEAIKSHRNAKGQKSSRTTGEEFYFQSGITYGKRTSILSVQRLEVDQLFTNEGHAIFPHSSVDIWRLIAILNSQLLQLAANTLCGQHKAVGYVRLLPYVRPTGIVGSSLERLARQGYAIKASWDTGNELCTRFDAPWLLQAHRGTLLAGETTDGRLLTTELDLSSLQSPGPGLQSILDYLLAVEHVADAHLQALQAQIDEAVYDLYEISPEGRALIERELGDRPPERVWPQMERKSEQEKRREHVCRLLSYCLLQALGEKRDGILPLTPGTGQPTALDEVRCQLEGIFGEEAAFRMEGEIKQVLGRDIAGWLEGRFFRWHCKLYKSRPIIWHLRSPGGHFACFVHYHVLDRDTLRKVQTLYLWPRRRAAESELVSAKAESAPARIEAAEAVLDDLAAFEEQLLSVIEARGLALNGSAGEIPDWAEGPFRGGVYDPVLDDGVKVNLTPLQEAEILRYKKVV